MGDNEIKNALLSNGFNCHTLCEGRLMALELLAKAGAGSYNSHTEECFLLDLNLMKKDRRPNKKDLQFIRDMVYASSNKKPKYFEAMSVFRK